MTEPLISLEEVDFAYSAQRPVLRSVSLALHGGERIGLTGPIGCGKTTLLHLAVGLLRPSSGAVHAFGKPRREESDFHEVRSRAGLVFQDPDDQLFSPTVIEDVAFGPLNQGKSQNEARTLAARTLERVGMSGFEERITYGLSGGEKRLISLASVLAMEPEVLLLDEPTGGLDEPSKDRVREILADLPQAMIIVSHEIDFVRGLATRTIVMDGGNLLELREHPT
jgi:cobalt/nickel transport system ATP-binding protein